MCSRQNYDPNLRRGSFGEIDDFRYFASFNSDEWDDEEYFRIEPKTNQMIKTKGVTVRAVLKVHSIEQYESGKLIKMSPDYSKDEGMKDFAKATPNAMFEIHVDDDVPASDAFKVGKFYSIDMTECEFVAEEEQTEE